MIQGESVELIIETPVGLATQPTFEVADIVHHIHPSVTSGQGNVITPTVSDSAYSGNQSCFVDVACFSNTIPEQAAVIDLYYMDGDTGGQQLEGQCSGTIINSGQGDLVVTTAGHCVGSNPEFASSVLGLWNYQHAACSNGSTFTLDNIPQSSTGRIIGINWSGAETNDPDVAVFVFNQFPTPYTPITYSGYSTRILDGGESVVSVSHPRGLPKKEATGTVFASLESNGLNSAFISKYHAEFPFSDYGVQFTTGMVDHGSSGSGLFDQAGELIGIDSVGVNDQNTSACDTTARAGGFQPFFLLYNLLSSFSQGSQAVSLSVNPSAISFQALQGSVGNTVSVEVSITTLTAQTIFVTPDVNASRWLTAPFINFTAGASGGSFTVTATAATLQPGTYTGSLFVTASPSGVSSNITLTFTVTAVSGVLNQIQTLPWLASGGGWGQSVTVVNSSGSLNNFQINFVTTDGAPLTVSIGGQPQTSVMGVLSPGSSSTIQLDSSQSLQTGWIEVKSSNPLLAKGRIITTSPIGYLFAAEEIAGMPVNRPGYGLAIPFDNTSGYTTGYAITNPLSQLIGGYVSVMGEDGSILSTQTLNIDPRSTISVILPAVFPSAAQQRGTVLIAINGAVAIGFLVGEAGSLTTVPALLQLNASTNTVLPWVAAGGGWQESVTVYSLLGSPSVTLSFHDRFGNPLTLNVLNDQDSATAGTITSQYAFSLPANGTQTVVLSSPIGSLVDGWVSIVGSGRLSSVGRIVLQNTSSLSYSALVESSSGTANTLSFEFDNTQGATTSFAITNTSTSSTTAYVTALDQNGNVLATRAVDLLGSQASGIILPDAFPETVGEMGSLVLKGQGSLAAIGFRFDPSGAFSTISATVLN